MHLKIGTRSSKLALAQTYNIIDYIKNNYPSFTFEIIPITTTGDKIQDKALSKIGDKGIFVSEIENKLLDHTIDIAIHSMKDLPSVLPDELTLTDVLIREDARDALILPIHVSTLKNNPIIGTSSVRRAAQIKQQHPDWIIKNIRGNIDTRLKKLDEGQYDAILLAVAGLKRLNLEERIYRYLEVDSFIPACCQGAIAIECRKDAHELLELLNSIANKEATICTLAERNFLLKLDGNCHMPMGGYCQKNTDSYTFFGIYGTNENQIHTIVLNGYDPLKLSNEASQILKEKQ